MTHQTSNVLKSGSLIKVRLERDEDEAAIEALAAAAFGPGRFSRAAFRLREGVLSDPKLSFVAKLDDLLAGSIKLTPCQIGGRGALVLGPLVVDPNFRKLGIGRELMNRSLFEARRQGHDLAVLVGDYAYYSPFGFERVTPGQITFPGPADPMRILACELTPGALERYLGQTQRSFG